MSITQTIKNSLASLLSVAFLFASVLDANAQSQSPISSPESSQEDRGIAFYPKQTGFGSFITVEVEPGGSAEETVVLGNSGNIDQVLRTYAIPAKSGINGGFVLAEHGAEVDEITSWLNYPELERSLAPGEGVEIDLVVNVPENTAPGEYVTALAAEQSAPFTIEGTDMSSQRVRWSIPILVIVPGERNAEIEIGGIELEWLDDSLYGTIEIANTGNAILNPVGQVRLMDAQGEVVGVFQIELQPLYARTETVFIVGWATPLLSQHYDVDLRITVPEYELAAEKLFEEVVPIGNTGQSAPGALSMNHAELTSATTDTPPSLLILEGEIANPGDQIENVRVSIVTYQDGVEVDRYPILQAVTINQGETPIEARYSLPGGFTNGTYTFEVTIEIGDSDTQTVLLTQPIDYEVVVGD